MRTTFVSVLCLIGFNTVLQAQWNQSGSTVTTSNQVIVNSSLRSFSIQFFDSDLGQNHDNTMFYRDDEVSDQTLLKLELGDEPSGSFEIGYRRYQDNVWVPNFSFKNGSLGIGTSTPDERLTVKGKIHSQEIKVDLSIPAPDYVFDASYSLRPLDEVKSYIEENKHLPEIPSASEFESDGITVGEMNMLLLKKIEELTLYILDQEERIKTLEDINN
ncbi:hypothetical protein [Leeuwenhoekiella sp. H156]|uniref:hypothetical protein n=1 Tax=Leeuwenhoekiella sp. H156 TaxID=3450128 RepID=UPI003FA4976B